MEGVESQEDIANTEEEDFDAIENLVKVESSLDSDFSYLSREQMDSFRIDTTALGEELCTTHIPEINDELRNHPYFFYPPPTDPGILKTLHNPEPILEFEVNGQKMYVFMCKTMNHMAVEKFFQGLLKEDIELKYYGISSNWMRAMCEALKKNRTIKRFDLSDNHLTTDACFHLGQVIVQNEVLTKINLWGCRVGPEGMRRLIYGIENTKNLLELNLSYNDLGDEGLTLLAPSMATNSIRIYNLSHNNLGVVSGRQLALALKDNETITDLDISWNHITNPGMVPLLKSLKTNPMERLNISWNGLYETKIQGVLQQMIKSPNMTVLDVSNNQLKGEIAISLSYALVRAKHLTLFRLGNNKLTMEDALIILENFSNRRVKCPILDLGDTNVSPEFMKGLESLKNVRKDAVVKYGNVIGNYTIEEPDAKKVGFQRAQYLGSKKKKDFGEFILRLKANLRKEKPDVNAFTIYAKKDGIPLNADLISYLCKPFLNKKKKIDLEGMAAFTLDLWPDTKLVLWKDREEEVTGPSTPQKKSNDKKDKKKKGKKI